MRRASTAIGALSRPDRGFAGYLADLQQQLDAPASTPAVPNPAESPRPGPRVNPSSSVRIFVVLTAAECDGLLRLSPDPDADALAGLAKIRSAIEARR